MLKRIRNGVYFNPLVKILLVFQGKEGNFLYVLFFRKSRTIAMRTINFYREFGEKLEIKSLTHPQHS